MFLGFGVAGDGLGPGEDSNKLNYLAAGGLRGIIKRCGNRCLFKIEYRLVNHRRELTLFLIET